MSDTGEKQGKAGNNGNVPPVDRQFGKPSGNKINLSGRPKSFDKLRKLAIKIAAEEAANTGMSRVQLMLTAMASSKNTADRKLFLEYAYGKVKDEVDVTSAGEKLTIRLVQDGD